MDTFSINLELPEPSYKISHYNNEGIVISSGPKNGLLWRGEVANPNDLRGSLKKIFETGFTPGYEHSPLAQLPYIKSSPDFFVCASNTYYIVGDNGKKEFTGFEHEQFSAGKYGVILLIDAKNIKSIPLCDENLCNPAFVKDYIGEQLNEGPDVAILKGVNPKDILCAIPSSEEAARSLGIEEKSFIKNPNNKAFCFEKIVIGDEVFLKTPDNFYDSDGENLKAEEKAIQSDAACTASNVTFFNRLSSESEYVQKHTPSSNYNTSM